MKRRGTEADSWGAFQLRYISYKKKPTWNHWLRGPDSRGILTASCLVHMREKGQRAINRLNRAVRRLKGDPGFPRRPSGFGQQDMDRIVQQRLLPASLLATFLEAIIFDRNEYICQHCFRSVASVWRESNKERTIGLVVDHCLPGARGGQSYSLENRLTACWSCNGTKSTLPRKVFDQELESLARAVLAGRSRRGDAG